MCHCRTTAALSGACVVSKRFLPALRGASALRRLWGRRAWSQSIERAFPRPAGGTGVGIVYQHDKLIASFLGKISEAFHGPATFVENAGYMI